MLGINRLDMAIEPQDQLRLFLALPVPGHVRAEFRRLQQELRPFLPSRSVRWARADQFHLTLKFLGNVPAAHTGELIEAVREICATTPPIPLRAEGTGFFPNHRAPRVFWAGIAGEDHLLFDFQHRLETAARRFSEKPETMAFAAHVTLARFQTVARPDVEKIISRARMFRDFGQWTADHVDLVRSTLSPFGATHAIFATFATKIV